MYCNELPVYFCHLCWLLNQYWSILINITSNWYEIKSWPKEVKFNGVVRLLMIPSSNMGSVGTDVAWGFNDVWACWGAHFQDLVPGPNRPTGRPCLYLKPSWISSPSLCLFLHHDFEQQLWQICSWRPVWMFQISETFSAVSLKLNVDGTANCSVQSV